MDQDPGLTPHPWLSIEIDDGRVSVDGSEIEVPGTTDDTYHAALQRIAEQVATPLGRQVGATVTGPAGASRHVAIHPDGTVEDLDELITAAAAPLPAIAPAEPAATAPATPSRRDWPGLLSTRPLVAGAAVALVALLSGVVVVSNVWGDAAKSPAKSDAVRVDADPSESPSPSAESVRAKPLRTLAATVRPTGPCQVRVVAGTSPRRAKVTVVFHSPDGTKVVRKVHAERGQLRLVVEQLPPGRTTWRVRTHGTEAVRGIVRVMPPPA